jgi:hypothetical protein
MKTLEIFESGIIEEYQNELVLPEYLYTSIYVVDINKIKESGLSPDISGLSWNDSVRGTIFFTEHRDFAGILADGSNKVNPNNKECIFILKVKSDNLNPDNIFIYNQSENPNENIYLYHSSLPYDLVEIAFSYL